jgi:hypothetical protein
MTGHAVYYAGAARPVCRRNFSLAENAVGLLVNPFLFGGGEFASMSLL